MIQDTSKPSKTLKTAWMGGPTRCVIVILWLTTDEGMSVKQSYGLKWKNVLLDWQEAINLWSG